MLQIFLRNPATEVQRTQAHRGGAAGIAARPLTAAARRRTNMDKKALWRCNRLRDAGQAWRIAAAFRGRAPVPAFCFM